MALVKKLDGTVEGKRIPLFDYTEKNIISEEDWRKACAGSILMVKGGEGKGGWKGETRSDGDIFEDDTLWRKNGGKAGLKGLGEKMMKKLNTAGILKISDLKLCCLDNERSSEMVSRIQGLSKKKMVDWKTAFENTDLVQGSVTQFDHRSATNPFNF